MEIPIDAAAGIVVTEMNTPMSVLALASVSETTPTIPASTATMTENTSGELMKSATGRSPARNGPGVVPDARMISPNTSVAAIVTPKPAPRAASPDVIARRSRLDMPSATAMMAAYSGPTTIAPTIRIDELIRRPTAPINPASMSST